MNRVFDDVWLNGVCEGSTRFTFSDVSDSLGNRLTSLLKTPQPSPATTRAPPATTQAPSPQPTGTTSLPRPNPTCHPNYSACLPIVADLDCGAISQRNFRIIGGNDPYRLDGDNDGIACES